MPVKAYWLDENKKDIVQYDFEGKWTWEEFYPVYEEALRMEKEQAHRVDVIMDFRRNISIPPNALTHIKGITDRQPVNIGLSIFVTTNAFINVMYKMAISIYPKTRQYFVIADTIEEAHAMIIKDREIKQESS